MVIGFYTHCIKAPDALVGIVMCWGFGVAWSFPDLRLLCTSWSLLMF